LLDVNRAEKEYKEQIKDLKFELNYYKNKASRLNNIIKAVHSDIQHELHGHILQHDEDSWNPEYYTNGKLDYRKLLIALLSDYENILIKGVDK